MAAYLICRKNKRRSASAAKFERNFEQALLWLEQELKTKTWKPGQYECFVVAEPKCREVWAADFRDRILHHVLVGYLEPTFERQFIFNSYACRKNKGTHRAIRRVGRLISAQPFFYLQLDIASFFTSIDKEILFDLLKKRTRNPDILWLAYKIIFHQPRENCVIHDKYNLLAQVPLAKSLFHAPLGKGLPIGNYTSQFFANVYLNELDHYVKHKLKCRHYFRYMDDFLLLHHSPSQLEKWKQAIGKFTADILKLKLHPKKQIIGPVRQGIDFLGYIIKPNYILARRRIIGTFKHKLTEFNNQLAGATTAETIEAVVKQAHAASNSYFGHFQHGNCFSLRKTLYEKHFGRLKEYLEPADKHFSHLKIIKI